MICCRDNKYIVMADGLASSSHYGCSSRGVSCRVHVFLSNQNVRSLCGINPHEELRNGGTRIACFLSGSVMSDMNLAFESCRNDIKRKRATHLCVSRLPLSDIVSHPTCENNARGVDTQRNGHTNDTQRSALSESSGPPGCRLTCGDPI